MKNIIISLFLVLFVYADESEKQYWDEVKNSSDLELLKSYKEQYPHGVFEKIVNIKIKRLLQSNKTYTVDIMKEKPFWIKGNVDYKFYGIGKANKHFKGKHYQENLARSRAKRNLMHTFENNNLTNEMIEKYNSFIEIQQYTDKRERVYILVYIDNYNL